MTAPHRLHSTVNPRRPLLRAWLNGPVRASFWISAGFAAVLVIAAPFMPWLVAITR